MYNKLFTKILDSSIWMEPVSTRIVWITFLAAMDENGFVQFASIPNVAHRAVVSLEEASKAVATLEAPDANSSDPDNEGRRVERVPGGWMVLNANKYRALVTREIIKEQTKDRVRRFRDAKEGNAVKRISNAPVTVGNAVVTQGNHSVTPSDTETKAEKDNTCADAPSAGSAPEGFAEFWELYPRKSDRKRATSAWKQIPLKEHAAIMANVAGRMRSDESWTKDGGKFIPHPTTYLNGRRWEDEFQSKIEMAPAKDAKPVRPNSDLTDEELWVRTGSSSMMALESFVKGIQPGGPFHYLRHEAHAPASQRERPL